MPSFKDKKIASEIQRHLGTIILTEARDEILKSITVTGCSVTKDLSFATVYFTSVMDMPEATLEKEVNQAASFLRGRLSEVLDVRHTPSLRFRFDKSVEYGQNIEKIITTLHKED